MKYERQFLVMSNKNDYKMYVDIDWARVIERIQMNC